MGTANYIITTTEITTAVIIIYNDASTPLAILTTEYCQEKTKSITMIVIH
jgi:hypothetical protein